MIFTASLAIRAYRILSRYHPPHHHLQFYPFLTPIYSNPQASTAATNPLPTAGPIFTAAPELLVGGAELEGEGLALPPCTFATATPLTPVAFLH